MGFAVDIVAQKHVFPSSRKSSTGIIPPIFHTHISFIYQRRYGPRSSDGIATELRAGQSGIESRYGRDFLSVQTGPVAYPASCKMSTESFPGVKCGRGVLLTTHSLLVPRSWKMRAIYPPSGPHRACNGIKFTFTFYQRRYTSLVYDSVAK